MSMSEKLKELEGAYKDSAPQAILEGMIRKDFAGQIALVSSFGIEAALLLSMVAEIDGKTPVIFLDTQKLFPETLTYRDTLITHLGLENVKTYYPDYIDVSRDDPEGDLNARRPNDCCFIRKVKPLNRALKPYAAWITGRKRYHGGLREKLPLLELQDGKIKLNPLASWNADMIRKEYESRALPPHPLAEKGYLSVGCVPCTSLPSSEGDVRSGRWQGQEKTECGIHLGADGKFTRSGS